MPKRVQLMFPKPKRLKGRNCRPADRDEAEKKRRGYKHPRSVVRLDGSEVLHGADWRKRRDELRERSDGRCEETVPYTSNQRCWKEAADPHHIVCRSKWRDDRLSNLQALCRDHHDLLDQRKVRWGASA